MQDDLLQDLEQKKRDDLERAHKLETVAKAIVGATYFVLNPERVRKRLGIDGTLGVQHPNEPEEYCGHEVLHKLNVDREMARQLVEDLIGSILSYPKMPWMCFNPRQGLKVQTANDEIEFLICEECGSVHYYGSEWGGDALLGPRQLRVFADLLKQNGLSLPD
jgi:hypothetical protein